MSAPGYAEVAFSNGYEFTRGTGYVLPEYPFVAPPEIASGHTSHHPIVIVGGGLAGLTLACALANYGVKAVLLDEDNTVGVKGASSRGICYTQKSLEIFHRLGVYERIAAKGIQWSVGRTFAGDDEVYSFDLKQQGAYNLSTQPPFINIQQFYIEAYLVDRIMELGHAEIRWSSRVTAFEQDEDGATLSITTPAGDYRMRADHVIDATGARSPFRQWAGASVTAKKGDDRWCIADVRFTKRPPVERHTWIEAPFNENRAVWQHLMGDDVWRIDYQLRAGEDPQEAIKPGNVLPRVQSHLAMIGENAPWKPLWISLYNAKCLTLDDYRARYALHRGEPELQAMHAACPWLVTWDDHEVANDYGGDQDRTNPDPAVFLKRRAAAYQAFYENMPLRRTQRPVGPDMLLYRSRGFGDLAQIQMLDTRQYRNRRTCDAVSDGKRIPIDCPERSDPARSLLGERQERWLQGELRASRARWNLLGQQYLMEQLMTRLGMVGNDGWDGYAASRRRVLETWRDAKVSNPVVLGGDIHCFFAGDLALTPGGPVVATEFVGGSISSLGASAKCPGSRRQ